MKLHQPRIKPNAAFFTHSRYPIFLLFCLFMTVYSMTYNGAFRVDDEHILASRSQSFALWGKLEEPQVTGNTRVQELLAYGDPATQIEPALSIIGAILYKAGIGLDLGGMQVLLTTNIFITTFSVLALFTLVRVLNYDKRTALWSSLAFGLGSIIWPYSATFLRDSLVMLMAVVVLMGMAIALYQSRRNKIMGILLMILGMLGGLLSKNSMLAIVPSLLLGLGYEAWRKAKWKEIAIAAGLVLLLLLLFASLLPTRGPLARYSWDYYRSLATHFLKNIKLSTLAWIAGPFISPSKSIFLFSPVLILIPWTLKRSWLKVPAWSITAMSFPILLALAQALFYGERWAGDFGWGLRFMLPALPGLIGVLAAYVADISGRRRRGRLFFIFIGIGMLVQMSASIVPWNLSYVKLQEIGLSPFDPRSSWSVRYLAIPIQIVGMLDPGHWNIAWLRSARMDPSAFLIPIASMTVIITSLLFVRAVHRRRSPIITAALSGVLLVSVQLPFLSTTRLTNSDPYWGKNITTYQAGLDVLQEEITKDDIVVLDAYGTPLWNVMMNQWDRPTPWISLPYEIITAGEDIELSDSGLGVKSSYLSGDRPPGASIWYFGSTLVPDFLSRDELRWLEQHYLECRSMALEGEVFVEVREFNQASCN